MRNRRKAGALALLAGTTLGALALVGANAQPAPDEGVMNMDGLMEPEALAERIGTIPRPPKTGDDKVACDRAARALERREAGLSTAEEHRRAMNEAKGAAASDAMKAAIDDGMIPSCPPDGDPTGRGARP